MWNYQNYRVEFGKTLKEARKDKGYSREKLAELTGEEGISYKTIERIEEAEYSKEIKFATIHTILKALGIKRTIKLG